MAKIRTEGCIARDRASSLLWYSNKSELAAITAKLLALVAGEVAVPSAGAVVVEVPVPDEVAVLEELQAPKLQTRAPAAKNGKIDFFMLLGYN